jgi:cell division septum initiation protein DivIVA
MATLLLKFSCDADALEAIPEGGSLSAGGALLEPLSIKADLSLLGSTLLISFTLQIPDLAPHASMRFVGEAGVLDMNNGIWYACAIERVFRPPEGRVKKLTLGLRREVLRYAGEDGRVRFGLIVGDIVLLPPRPRSRSSTQAQAQPQMPTPTPTPSQPGSEPVHRAYLRPDFVVRRLRSENERLRTDTEKVRVEAEIFRADAERLRNQLRSLESEFDNVLETVCPDSEPTPGAGSGPSTSAARGRGRSSALADRDRDRDRDLCGAGLELLRGGGVGPGMETLLVRRQQLRDRVRSLSDEVHSVMGAASPTSATLALAASAAAPHAERPQAENGRLATESSRLQAESSRIQAENKRLQTLIHELEANLASALESADDAAVGQSHLPNIVANAQALIERANPTELRDLQAALRILLSSAATELTVAESCMVCLDQPVGIAFSPCGHACCCAGCSAPLAHCPICRAVIIGTRAPISSLEKQTPDHPAASAAAEKTIAKMPSSPVYPKQSLPSPIFPKRALGPSEKMPSVYTSVPSSSMISAYSSVPSPSIVSAYPQPQPQPGSIRPGHSGGYPWSKTNIPMYYG